MAGRADQNATLELDNHTALEAAARAAEQLWARGATGEALDSYARIVAARLDWARRAGPAGARSLGAADMVVIERLADLAILHGRAEGADQLLAGMVTLIEGAGNAYGAAYAQLKRQHLALGRGDLRDAYAMLEAMAPQIGDLHVVRFAPEPLEVWERGCRWAGADAADRGVLFSRLYLGMGGLLAGLGQYQDAQAAYTRGLAHAGEGGADLARRAAVPLRLGLTTALLERGAIGEAEAQIRGLEARIDERRDTGFAARRIELLGRAALLRGELGTALEHLEAVEALCRRFGLRRATLYARLNLAHALVLVNQTSDAGALAAGAGAEARASGDQPAALRAAAIERIARARSHSLGGALPIAAAVQQMRKREAPAAPTPDDRPEAAPPPLDLPQSGEYLSFFEDRALGLHWLLGHRRFAEAETQLAQMRLVFGRSDSAIIQARLGLLAGLLAYYQDDAAGAAAQLEGAIEALRALGLTGDLWQAQRVLGWCWARLGRPAAEREALAAETATQLEHMVSSFDGAARTIFLLNKWTADEEYIASELNALVRMRREAARAPWLLRPLRRLALTRRLARLIEHLDRYKDQRARTVVSGKSPGAPARRPALLVRLLTYPRDRVTLGALVLPDRVLVTRMSWLRLDFALSPVTRLELRGLVRRWHEQVEAAGAGRGLFVVEDEQPAPLADERPATAARVAAALQLPQILAGLPARVRAITIVPDDSLHGFPFAALPHGDGYLIQRYRVSVAYEHSTPAQPPAGRAPHSVLVGSSIGGGAFRPLPGVRREIERVRALLTANGLEPEVLLDQAATREAVATALERASFAHIAAHGVFKVDQPEASGIVLTTATGEPDILSLRDLMGQQLGGLGHITLASCWSADQFVLPGRWVISLPETLGRGGVGSVLGSLWEVDDQLAVTFMERFYGYLAHHPRDEALRRAQLDFLGGEAGGRPGGRATDPRFWACFTVYGHHARLGPSRPFLS